MLDGHAGLLLLDLARVIRGFSGCWGFLFFLIFHSSYSSETAEGATWRSSDVAQVLVTTVESECLL